MKAQVLFIPLLLMAAGIAAGLAAIEGGMRLAKGAPPALERDENFYWSYVDIYAPFFAKDPSGAFYESRRPRSLSSRFPVVKGANEKRVFIAGESIAYLFDAGVLQKKLREAAPGYDWKVFNCGMNGYDSYRIALVVREIARYRPDLVVLLMGNNDGCYQPETVNHWLYACPLLSRFWITRVVTDCLNPPVTAAEGRETGFYERNLTGIVRSCRERGVPLALCTAPINHMVPYKFYANNYEERPLFNLMWLAEKDPREAVRAYSAGRTPDKERFFLARAYENMGDHAKADELYRKNTIQDRAERNGITRSVARRNEGNVILVDLYQRFLDISDGKPGFELFWDEMHFWPPVYGMIADEIVGSLARSRSALLEARGLRFGAAAGARASGLDVPALLRENSKALTDEYYARFGGRFLSGSFGECGFTMYILKGWYRQNRDMIVAFRENKAKVMSWVKGDREANWNRHLAEIGELLREEKDYGAALSYLNDAIRADKKNGSAYLFRGLCHYDRGEKEAAEADFLALRELNPRFKWLGVRYLDSLVRGPGPRQEERDKEKERT